MEEEHTDLKEGPVKITYQGKVHKFDNYVSAAEFLLKRAKDGEEFLIESTLWTFMNLPEEGCGEFKVSPFGSDGDYDKDCFWLDPEEVQDELKSLWGSV